ncbi:hypothetical protein FRUB_07436 [Fimbriiglobus ruber]|uniref:Uncharacterized protein n=1 Tax=Fimbriiglobus ruber TaxID=1908690 RepID=A0A225DLF4_9BACT|nr:hypothetical protein FRUB_07436 [Fimbriiglobus ruber]
MTGRAAIPLFDLDLSDPDLGITIPGLTRLTTYYPFCTTLGRFDYRLLSDDRIEPIALSDNPLTPDVDSVAVFDAQYANGFRYRPMEITWTTFDSRNPDDYFFYRNLFSFPELDAAEEQTLLDALNTMYPKILNPPADTLENADYELPDIFFPVGYPVTTCPNPGCQEGKKTHMQFFMLIQPEEDEEPLYSTIAGGDSGRLSFVWCEYCQAISVSNQCT